MSSPPSHPVPSGSPPPYDSTSDNNYHGAYREEQEAAEAGESGSLLLSRQTSNQLSSYRRRISSDTDIDSLLDGDSDDEPLGNLHQNRVSLESVHREIEQFEVIEPSSSRQSLSTRASLASQRIATSFSSKIISPVQRMLDPIAAFFNLLSIKADAFISKFGNPLIIKRLLYLFFVFLLIYIAFESGVLPGSTKDAFGGEYYDRQQLEEFLQTAVNKNQLQERVEYLSSMPHLAGTAGDLTLAKYVEDQMQSFGMKQVALTEHVAYISYPNDDPASLQFELLGENPFKASMKESLMYEHPSDSQTQPRAFHALSSPGEVEGPLIYANYGTLEDLVFLRDHGAPVEGCILLIKNGKMDLGMKAKLAQDLGAIGIVTFSDSDSSNTNSMWPHGPGYPMGAVERGSLGIGAVIPGDILSPGYSSISSERIAEPDMIHNLPKIVSAPVSWNDVKPFLEAINGYGLKKDDWASTEPNVQDWWTGNNTSPRARLIVNPVIKERHPIWNVRSKLEGLEQRELAIIVGAKRDSWCYGASGSASGTSVMLEVARIFTLMSTKLKWIPLRSIYFASWDGGDQNMAGTTEWVEYNINTLRQTGVVYINLDDVISGSYLDIKGHPMLKTALREVLDSVNDPVLNQSLSSIWDINQMRPHDAPGDHSPFLSYAGIVSVDLGFRGKHNRVPKHSCFDSIEWIKKFGDPKFDYHTTMVNIISKLILKMADDPIVPLDISAYADALEAYTNDLEQYATSSRDWSLEAADTLKFTPLREAANKIREAYDAFIAWRDDWIPLVTTTGEPPSFMHIRWSWNARLVNLDKHLLDFKGVPGRKWFKHIIFGPQLWHPTDQDGVGKESKYLWGTFPAARDAIQAANWKAAKESVERVGAIILLAASKLVV